MPIAVYACKEQVLAQVAIVAGQRLAVKGRDFMIRPVPNLARCPARSLSDKR